MNFLLIKFASKKPLLMSIFGYSKRICFHSSGDLPGFNLYSVEFLFTRIASWIARIFISKCNVYKSTSCPSRMKQSFKSLRIRGKSLLFNLLNIDYWLSFLPRKIPFVDWVNSILYPFDFKSQLLDHKKVE